MLLSAGGSYGHVGHSVELNMDICSPVPYLGVVYEPYCRECPPISTLRSYQCIPGKVLCFEPL